MFVGRSAISPAKDPIVKYTSGHTTPSFSRMSAPLIGGRILMEYKGVEYSVVQLTEGSGWRWELNLGEGKSKSGVTRVSRAVAIKHARYEIDRVLRDRK